MVKRAAHNKIEFTKEEEKDVCEKYNSGKSMRELFKEKHTSRIVIKRILQ